ncbi:sorting nexin-29-like [Pollicipes pollicipes]|uniref:sorting nexin-29-like n=1 Tax=Pollicipes pollicipes TaxID=41117 RepID=UPI001884B4BC|nr:sorting nexin-29-like [Pollicipes pollicipes]
MEYKSEERQNILSRLLDAVKQCHIRFGGKKELATDMDSRISCLCQQLETVLQHGMKQPEPNAFRQVRDAIAQNLSINIGTSGPSAEAPVMWHYVRLHLTQHEYERYLLLVNINTDAGRGRAWLRSALNESSLERYMHALIGDKEGMAQFYEPWAVIADQERNAMLPNIAAGLSSILFAISIDREELNGHRPRARARPAELSGPESGREPEAVVKAHSVEVRSRPAGRRRRRRVHANVVSLDGEVDPDASAPRWRSAPSTCVSSPAPTLPGASSGEDVGRLEEGGEIPHQLRPCDPDGGEASALTPLDQYSASLLETVAVTEICNGRASPVGSAEVERTSPSAHQAALVASSAADLASVASLSEGQLREALVAVSEQRSALGDQAGELRSRLEAALQESQQLREDGLASNAMWKEKLATLESRRLTSERENVILKHQLKKYVSAVQLLRHGSPHEILDQLQEAHRSEELQQRGRRTDYHAEAEAYQQKLIQVAEMHGELMEFNDRLRGQLTRRERQLAALRAELAECGLSDDEASEPAEPGGEHAPPPPPPPPRVHCWIPSAFLSGTGNGAHHVYQVYVRIRDEEWNIYHRYSSFFLLYSKMKKDFTEVREFDFPPKKALNKKDGRLVETRRRRLQEFLRCVTRALLAARPELARSPSRAALVNSEGKFREGFQASV